MYSSVIGTNNNVEGTIMKKEIYENLELEVIRFRTEDVITTSEVIPDPTPSPETSPEPSPETHHPYAPNNNYIGTVTTTENTGTNGSSSTTGRDPAASTP